MYVVDAETLSWSHCGGRRHWQLLKLVNTCVWWWPLCADVYCSPSRSSLMSGRLPYHVNQINLGGYYVYLIRV